MLRDLARHPVLRCKRGAALLLLLALCAAPAITAPAAGGGQQVGDPSRQATGAPPPDRPPTDPDAVIPVSEIRAGMKGYGFTVFQGDEVERFDVTVVGVLPKMYMGQDMVLVRLDGGPITERDALLIHGMSGSPVYIDGRLVGAFSMGASGFWAKEPLGAVTPIGAMLEALDPKLDTDPIGMTVSEVTVPFPIVTEGGPIREIFLGPQSLAPPQRPGRLTLQPLATPLMVSGVSPRTMRQLGSFLDEWNLLAHPAPGGAPPELKRELEVGGSLGVTLMTGDIEMSGIGTVTWMKDDRVLGWGHPMFGAGIGAARFGITNAWVYDIFPGVQASNKIAAAGEILGTLDHDRPFSVAGTVGDGPPMVPIVCRVQDKSTGRERVFRAEAVDHPLLVGQLATIAVMEAIFQIRPVPGDVTADVQLAIETDGLGRIERRNKIYDEFAIDIAATQELAQMLQLLSSNRLRRVPVKSLEVDVVLEKERPTATIERIFVKQEVYEPGEPVEVGVVLRLARGETAVLRSEVEIPEGAQNGRAILMVNGGATRIPLAALLGGSGGGQLLPGGAPPATSVEQLVRDFLDREKNNQIVTRLLFNSTAVTIEGEKLADLPSSLVEVMRSARTTGLRVEQDEAKEASDTDYVVQGFQRLFVTIQRRDSREQPSGSRPGAGSPGVPPGGIGGPGIRPPIGDIGDFGAFGLTLPDLGTVTVPLPAVDGQRQPPPTPPTGGDGDPGDAGGQQTQPDPPDQPERPDSDVIGKATQWWLQSTYDHFRRGTHTGTAATLRGELRQAPRLRKLHESTEQFMWSAAALNGAYYVGTGNGGLVLRVQPDGTASEFFDTEELQVHALATDGNGNLYAGTVPHGRVYRIDSEGDGTLLFALAEATPNEDLNAPPRSARYILSLATAPDGSVYAGTGPEGKIYRISAQGEAELYFEVPDTSVTSLLLANDGTLYAGTAESGLVFAIRGRGDGRVVAESGQKAVTALARDEQGNVYAATSPKGTILQISPDGRVRERVEEASGGIHGMVSAADGVIYACSPTSIYRLEPGGDTLVLAEERQAQFVGLERAPDGRLLAASANIGSLYVIEPPDEGTYESPVHDAKRAASWGRLRWSGEIPEAATVLIETRTGNTPEPDRTWSSWQPPQARADGAYVASPSGRYLQYRARFQGSEAVALREIRIAYRPRNQPPSLTLAEPKGGELWSGEQEIKWSGSDPDRDTLTYEVFFSRDGGESWDPIGKRLTAPGAGPPGPTSTTVIRPTAAEAAQALERYREMLAQQPGLTDAQRQQAIREAEELLRRYQDQGVAVPPGALPGAAGAQPGATPPGRAQPPSGATRQSNLKWDTSEVPDGIYLIRVVASDKVSNPSDPLTDEQVSGPVIVTNTPPITFVFARGAEVDEDGRVTVQGYSQARVPIKGAQYRFDEGDWFALDPEDGIWDGSLERWRFTHREPLEPGEYKLQVKAVDIAGNASVTEAPIVIPKPDDPPTTDDPPRTGGGDPGDGTNG